MANKIWGCRKVYLTSEEGRICPDAIDLPLGGQTAQYVVFLKDKTLACYWGYFNYSKVEDTEYNPSTGWFENGTPISWDSQSINESFQLFKIYGNHITVRQICGIYRCDDSHYKSLEEEFGKEIADECKSLDGEKLYFTYDCDQVAVGIDWLLKEYPPYDYNTSEIDFSGLK